MNKIVKNSTLLKNIMIIVLASLLCIVSLIYFIQSYSFYSDEWGTDISIDSDYLVLFLCSICILIYGIYSLVAYKKNLCTKNAYFGCFGVASVLIGFYPLGIFFKSLAKEIPYIECQGYLYMGIIGIAFIMYLAFSYFEYKKN